MDSKKEEVSDPNPQSDQLDTSSLPLAKIIRYHDDFLEKSHIIRTSDDRWVFITDGVKISIAWSAFPSDTSDFFKAFLSWAIARYNPTSVISFIASLKANSVLLTKWLRLLAQPNIAKQEWHGRDASEFRRDTSYLLRLSVRFMCEMSLFGWSPKDVDFISGWHWYPQKNASSVNNGQGYYLQPDEEFKLISYFDRLAAHSLTKKSTEELKKAAILYLSYQFGMRAFQTASLKRQDVKIFKDKSDGIVHVTFHRAKQRDPNLRYPMPRKVKRSWAPIIIEYYERHCRGDVPRSDLVHPESFFCLTPKQLGENLKNSSEKLLGRPVTPGQFRRVYGQRMADSGMSQLQVADAMGHEDIDSCLVYFENSAIHGHIVNRALGLSKIYQEVKNVAQAGFITPNALDDLSPDKQIGGAAHGIALAGIGGCTVGQSLCSLSPAISCYTCPKFLPLNDIRIHENVAEELRSVVMQFKEAGRHDHSNPAFAQLTHTMTRLSEIIQFLMKGPQSDE